MVRETTIDRTQGLHPILIALAAWVVPGAGHLWGGQRGKGLVFAVTYTYTGYPLVALAAVADVGIGAPYLVGKALSLGAGTVTAVTYEYGNTFLIVAGLLNLLVVCDAWDFVTGRK